MTLRRALILHPPRLHGKAASRLCRVTVSLGFFLSSACGIDSIEAPSRAPLQGPSAAQAMDRGRAHLHVIYVPSSGFAYPGEDGRLTGVTVELMRGFGEWLEATHGLEVELEFHAEERWATFYEQVQASAGGVFGIGNVTITDARRGEVDFSPPYLTNVAILITHEDIPELAQLDAMSDAFRDLTGLSYPGTLHEARMEALRRDHFPEMETIPVESNVELVGRVASGEGYFGYIDIYNYWRAREDGAPLRHHPVGDDASETFGVILPRGSDWTPLLEQYFQVDGPLQETERHRELLRLHLGEELAGLLTGSP
jgi:ABC-type amino acid transport substrate-binding protein